MKKRLVFLASLILFSFMVLGKNEAFAATKIDSGSCGKNVTWSLDSNGILTISGKGEMYNYDQYYHAPWKNKDYCSSIVKVVIEDGVTLIGDSSFANCSKLKSVNIPDSVEDIGFYAFLRCVELESVEIPKSVECIGAYAFSECSGLTSVKFPDSNVSIGSGSFDGCTSLTNVTIPKSITSIGYNSFGYYYNYDDNSWNKIEDFTITTTKGSAADEYATDNGIKVIYKSSTETSIAIKTVSVSSSSLSYTGKALKPGVTVKDSNKKVVDPANYTVTYSNNKSVGIATITVKGKNGYTGTVKTTFTINPKATTVSSAKNSASKTAAVTWKKNSTVTGYEIQYSTDKNFKKDAKTVKIKKNSTVKYTLSSLTKNKTYYVRVRTYKTVSKKNYYSAWSTAKSVKITK